MIRYDKENLTEMVTEIELVLDKLQAIYDRAINANSKKVFFITLFEYVDLFDNQPLLEPVWQSIVELGRSEVKPLQELENQSIQEMQTVYKQVRQYVTDKKLTGERLLSELDDYEALESGRLTTSQGPIRGRHGYLSYSLMLLVEHESKQHLDFCRQFGIIDERGRIQKWTFSPSFNTWEDKRKIMDRIQLTRVWYSWDKLVNFYRYYSEYEEMAEKSLKEHKMWELWGHAMMYREIAEVIEEKQVDEQPRYFVYEDLQNHLQRVHFHVREVLMRTSTKLDKKPEKETQTRYSYDPNTGRFSLGSKTIRFQVDSMRGQILKVITDDSHSREEPWNYDELHELIQGTDDMSQKDKMKIYEGVQGITERIAKEFSVSDFLEYDMNTVSISKHF